MDDSDKINWLFSPLGDAKHSVFGLVGQLSEGETDPGEPKYPAYHNTKHSATILGCGLNTLCIIEYSVQKYICYKWF